MVGQARLPGQQHVVTDLAAARHANLRHDQAALPDAHIVRDVDQIVDFGVGPDHGITDTSPVDGSVGPDLDPTFEQASADVAGGLVASGGRQVSKSVAPDAGAGSNHDVVAQL